MKYILLRFLLAVLIFFVGVSAVGVWRTFFGFKLNQTSMPVELPALNSQNPIGNRNTQPRDTQTIKGRIPLPKVKLFADYLVIRTSDREDKNGDSLPPYKEIK